MVSCLLVIAIGGILTKILLNTFVQIKAHGFCISDPEAANAVPLTRHPILARGSTERFQKILAGNRHNALLFAPRFGELKAPRGLENLKPFGSLLLHIRIANTFALASSRHNT